MLALYHFSEFSYTKTERTIHTGGQSLPVSITSVGCYSSNERLIDCAHDAYDFPVASVLPKPISMDVSISCHQSSEQQKNHSSEQQTTSPSSSDNEQLRPGTSSSSSDNEKLRRVSTASLAVAVICVISVVFLVALLVIVFVLRRRGKYNPR